MASIVHLILWQSNSSRALVLGISFETPAKICKLISKWFEFSPAGAQGR